MSRPRQPFFRMSGFLGALGLLLAFCFACGSDEEASGPAKGHGGKEAHGPNLLLVTMDTARADHFGCYGSTQVKTPHVDRLAEEGILFTNATTAAPLTLPAHSSLFTGVYPLTHGVRDNLGFELPEKFQTLAETLRDEGWKTAGFISAYVLHSSFGVGQGFDYYADQFEFERQGVINAATVQRDGKETLKQALAWLDENHGSPFFAWVHFYDPHVPYDPPEPFLSEYPDDKYAGEIAYTDELVGELLAHLDELGCSQNTVVAVVGDHGEGRGDHKEALHGLFVYDESVQVPFVIRAPGYAHRKVDAQVRVIDIMPTLLDLLGAGEAPSEGAPDELLRGKSLLPLIRGEKQDLKLAAYSETFYPSLHYGWSDLKSLRTGKYKYIEAPKPELYDLTSDPKEQTNLLDAQPETARKMKDLLDELQRRSGGAHLSRREKAKDDAKSLEALRALGYAGGTVPGVEPDASGLPDPKDKVDILNVLDKAQRLLGLNQPMKALPLLKEVVSKEPQMVDGLVTLSIALYKMEDYEQAVGVLRRTLKISPEMFAAWMNLGLCMDRLGRPEEAVPAYERAHELDPSNTETMNELVDIYFKLGRFKKAVDACQQYLEEDPKSVRVYSVLAMALVNRGQVKEAEEAVKKGLDLNPQGENLYYSLGKIFQGRSRFAEAADAYEKELSVHKRNPDTYLSLYQVCKELGDLDRSIRALTEAAPLFQNNFSIQFALAKASLEKGTASDEALAAAKKAVELKASSSEAWDTLDALQKLR